MFAVGVTGYPPGKQHRTARLVYGLITPSFPANAMAQRRSSVRFGKQTLLSTVTSANPLDVMSGVHCVLMNSCGLPVLLSHSKRIPRNGLHALESQLSICHVREYPSSGILNPLSDSVTRYVQRRSRLVRGHLSTLGVKVFL
ncbi:hypothetical protein J6590_015277 [Homalodisca vitripennis]|nr:hypothetical protein J6590_015277 [Homalodisca vitripennis]